MSVLRSLLVISAEKTGVFFESKEFHSGSFEPGCLLAVILDDLHPSLRVIYKTFMAASSLQALHGMTTDVRVGGGAPSTVWARLEALIAVGSRRETFLFFGPTGTKQKQQQTETEQLHGHPEVRIKLWNDIL